MFNVISAVMSLFNGTIFQAVERIQTLLDGTNQFVLATTIWLIAVIAAFLAEIIGAFVGFKAHQAAREMGTEMIPGDWSQEMRQPAQAGMWGGGGGGGGPTNWGGGTLGGGPGNGGGYLAGNRNDDDDVPTRVARPAGNFQVFSGTGQRLGGE